jgi:hypothetical protein
MKPFITHLFLVRRALWGLIFISCLPLWCTPVAGQQGSVTGPLLLTYNDLVALYENDVPSEELNNRLTRLLTTAFVNNTAGTRAGSGRVGNSIRVAMWNIERGLITRDEPITW